MKKRSIKALKKRILGFKDQIWSEADKKNLVAFAISGLIGIVIAISVFVTADKVPATSSDYRELKNRLQDIEQNPDLHLLLETECSIDIAGEVITVSVENEQCRMIAKYNKDFKLLSSSKEDKAMSWGIAIILALILACVEIAVVGMVLYILISVFEMSIEWVSKMLKK